MILYLYYLGEVIERSTNLHRKEYELYREYLFYHYWKVAIKTYKLFRIVELQQIFRTLRIFTVTTIEDLTLMNLMLSRAYLMCIQKKSIPINSKILII